MNSFTITYTYNYRLDFANHYVFTNCGKCMNLKTGRLIKKVYNSGCIGYNIKGKFYSLTKLRNHLEKVNKDKFLYDLDKAIESLESNS